MTKIKIASISAISDHLKKIGTMKEYDNWVSHEVTECKETDGLQCVGCSICEIRIIRSMTE